MREQSAINRSFGVLVTGALTLALPVPALADGIVVDKVYHPYVDALEHEFEYRAVAQDDQAGIDNPAQLHQVAIGNSFGDRWFGEIYAKGTKNQDGNFHLGAFEVELKWQLTEQGEFFADWGLLFEYENEVEKDIQEITVGILAEKEFGRWSGAANLLLVNEWGDDIVNEYETALAVQARYRYSQGFEPGVEFYAGQDARGIGPVIQGTVNLGIRKNLHWETGVIWGLGSDSPNSSFRFLLEYEF